MNLRQDQLGFEPSKYSNLIVVNKEFYLRVQEIEFTNEQLSNFMKF